MNNNNLGRNWAQSVNKKMTPQPQIQPQQPLSNKTGLSPVKKTALQQGVITNIAQGMKPTVEG